MCSLFGGEQRPFGQVLATIMGGLTRTELTALEKVVARDFFGIEADPSDPFR